ncbi:MAG: hypothetical protein JXA46_08045 [Dehalococcoidales bacterium]|nr:hypothetical protein [Dehalococcoidales bacterium]
MSKIFISAKCPEDWKRLLAEPEKHWQTGYSARTLAYCWQEADGFPSSVKNTFKDSSIELFHDVKLIVAFPEYWAALKPYMSQPSQSDIFALARAGNGQLISVTVEGKVDEPFDRAVADWQLTDMGNKQTRLKFLSDELERTKADIEHIRYQLLRRIASTLLEAKRFNAPNALMLVHSFSRFEGGENKSFQDYCAFVSSFGKQGRMNSVVFVKNVNGIDLYLAWVNGERKYLES